MAETDLAAARSALHDLRRDHMSLSLIEDWLGGDPHRATFALGAVMRLADAELGTPVPDLSSLLPEMLYWLEGDW